MPGRGSFHRPPRGQPPGFVLQGRPPDVERTVHLKTSQRFALTFSLTEWQNAVAAAARGRME